MSTPVRVQSIDSLKAFKAALRKFIETANVALGDSESDVNRVLNWLEGDAPRYWEGQLRKRTEAVTKAKEALRHKKLFKQAGDHTSAAVEEEKALRLAVARLAEAEQKLANVKRHTRQLHKELSMYKGGVQRFITAVQHDLPVATAKLEAMVRHLEQYVAMRPTEATSTAAAGPESAAAAAVPAYDGPSMARAEGAEVAPQAESREAGEDGAAGRG